MEKMRILMYLYIMYGQLMVFWLYVDNIFHIFVTRALIYYLVL